MMRNQVLSFLGEEVLVRLRETHQVHGIQAEYTEMTDQTEAVLLQAGRIKRDILEMMRVRMS